MELTTLQIDVEQAKAKLDEYTKLLAGERTCEDEAIAAAYRAAAKGMPVISLKAAITAGGWFDNGLPRIAICRADASRCAVTWLSINGPLVYRDAIVGPRTGYHALVGHHTVRVDIEQRSVTVGRRASSGITTVPLVPPQHRPANGRLHLYHVLWEVEQWDPIPPHDPALLRHILGDLWTVHAVWDLTEIERHVLSARASR